MGFPSGSVGKESAYNAGDLDSVPGLGRFPGGGQGNSLYYSCLENPQGQKSLAGYSPWGRKEKDTTEQLSLHACMHSLAAWKDSWVKFASEKKKTVQTL